MSLVELFPAVRSLPHQDKVRLLQFLAGELAREEGLSEFMANAEHPIWSPYDAYDVAAALKRALDAEGAKA